MSISRKYGRTYHFPWSPGTTSDDRISHDYWIDIYNKTVIALEKLDGENTCLNKTGVFARSHAAPTLHPWADYLKMKWSLIKNDLGDLEIFGENIFAVHSIEYPNINSHFYVFGVRENDRWLSWEEVKFYASMLDFPVVPEIKTIKADNQKQFESDILEMVKCPSAFGSNDIHSGQPCTMEGVVVRNVESYSVDNFSKNVWKWVRKNHVKTDDAHWTRSWKRAPLMSEKPNEVR